MDYHRCTSKRGQLDLDDDSWCLIFDKLESRKDQSSFGLTSHRFLNIQNLSLKCLTIGCFYTFFDSKKCSRKHPTIDILMVDKLLNRFAQLDTLNLGSCLTSVSDSYINLLRKHGSKLKSINLNHCRRITNNSFTSLASGCPLLSVISLAHSNVTDTLLESLTRSCKYLKEVNLAWCKNVTDSGILSINQNCRQLRALVITGCRQIRGVSISPTLSCLDAKHCDFDSTGIVSGSGSSLEYLKLSTNFHISPGGLSLGFASKLKILNFFNCDFVEDDDIIKISRACPLLQHWNLTLCKKLGIAAWDSIGSYCRNLETQHDIAPSWAFTTTIPMF